MLFLPGSSAFASRQRSGIARIIVIVRISKVLPETSVEYIDIGHGMSSFTSMLWLYRDGKLETHSAATGTHNGVWGPEAMHCWRGRFDMQTRQISIAKPALEYQESPPPELLAALKAKFDFEASFLFCGSECRKLEST